MAKGGNRPGEFDVISRILAPLSAAERGAFNLTDDAALISPRKGGSFVVTADAIVEGVIDSIEKQPMRVFSSNVLQTSEFELTLKVSYQVVDRVSGAVLMKGIAVGVTPFFTETDLVNSDIVTLQNMNYPTAAQRMGASLVSKVSEGW
jgi:hypothetical protein